MRSFAPAFALACLALVAASATGHPRVLDDHNACLIVGWNWLGTGGGPIVPIGQPVSEWAPHASLLYPDNLCVPPGSSFAPTQGADWSSHAASCAGVPPGTSVPGAYCGGAYAGAFTCVTQEHPLFPNAGLGIVLGVDANGDGRVNQLDNSLSPDGAAVVTEVMPATPTPETFKGPVAHALPAGRIIAYVAPQGGVPAPAVGAVLAACW